MPEKRVPGRLPGQTVAVYANQVRLLVGIGVHDQALRGGDALVRVDFDKSAARQLITDLIDVYEGLYGDDFTKTPESADSQAI